MGVYKRASQKILSVIFVGAFFIILVIGTLRAKHQQALEAVLPVADSNNNTATSTASSNSAAAPNTTKPTTSTPPTPNTTPTKPTPPQNTTPPANNTPPTNTKQSFTGTSYRIPWGTVTVAIEVQNGKIVAVSTPNIPDSPPSQYADPILIDQATKAGSSNIQGVSGATYTTIAFQKSLESAIAKAGIQ